MAKRVKRGKTPVIRKDLDGDIIAEANNDGSIYVNKNVKPGSPLEKEAIAHEKVHIKQMDRGDLNYDDNNVYWKGKVYPRSSMNEGADNLPWEKEAYNKTKHMKSNKKDSALKMGFDANTQSAPITYKSSALKRVAEEEEGESGKKKPAKKADKLWMPNGGLGDYSFDSFLKAENSPTESGYSFDVKGVDTKPLDLGAFDKGLKEATGSKKKTETSNDVDAPKGNYNMGYEEARSADWGERVGKANNRRNSRQMTRRKENFDTKGKNKVDPSTGDYFTREDWTKRHNNVRADFNTKVGKTSPAKMNSSFSMGGYGSKSKK